MKQMGSFELHCIYVDPEIERYFKELFNTNHYIRVCLDQIFTTVWLSLIIMYIFFQYLTKKLGVDPVFFGYLQTTFAVVQLCGGPVYGRFGDMFGGRAAMVLAFASASATYFLMGIADSFFLLFISRLPSIFMHAMQG